MSIQNLVKYRYKNLYPPLSLSLLTKKNRKKKEQMNISRWQYSVDEVGKTV